MADIKYKKIENIGATAIYGMFDRYWLVGTCTEDEIRDTLAMCERDLSGECDYPDNYLKSVKRLRESLLEALEVA